MSKEKPQELTLAQRIDQEFANYKDPKDAKQKTEALAFLIYVFDIREKDSTALQKKLDILEQDRNKHKADNPEYIPGKKPRQLKLEPEDLILQKTKVFGKSDNDKVNRLLSTADLLDVREESRRKDESVMWEEKTTYLTPEKRNRYRVLINNGLLKKDNTLCDSSGCFSHDKPDTVSWTLNANGELSLFEHLHGDRNNSGEILLHSSMNAGAPVYAAGELMVKDGKITALSTHSGHYTPSLYNTYRMLQFLSEQDVDLSEVKIYVQDNLNDVNVYCTEVPDDGYSRYRVDADQIYKVVDTEIIKSVNKVCNLADEYVKNDNFWYHTKDFFTGSTLTELREKLAMDLTRDMQEFCKSLKHIKTDFQLNFKIEELEKKLDHYVMSNNLLSKTHGKDDNTGRLAEKLQETKREIEQLRNSMPEGRSEMDVDVLKSKR